MTICMNQGIFIRVRRPRWGVAHHCHGAIDGRSLVDAKVLGENRMTLNNIINM
jgi:hypothetical protein